MVQKELRQKFLAKLEDVKMGGQFIQKVAKTCASENSDSDDSDQGSFASPEHQAFQQVKTFVLNSRQ